MNRTPTVRVANTGPKMHRICWQIGVVITTFFVMACGSGTKNDTAQSTGVGTPGPNPTTVKTDVLTREQRNAVLSILPKAAADIPRDTFAAEAVVRKVGSDPGKLLAWVRDNTEWLPYRGVLKGATGVLMDGSGSNADRAVLLAELLRQAGHSVRLARATLSPERARTVLGELRLGGPIGSVVTPTSATTPRTVDDYARQAGIDPRLLRSRDEQIRERVAGLREETARRVASQVLILKSKVGPRDSQAEESKSAVLAVQDHWWVQWDANGRWIDLDPLLVSPVRPEQTFIFDSDGSRIPLGDRFIHYVELRVVVEQTSGGTATERVALSHRLTPAEAVGVPLVLRIRPANWPESTSVPSASGAAAFRDAATRQRVWIPTLTVEDRTISQSAFTEEGDLVAASGVGNSPRPKPTDAMLDAFGGGSEDPGSNLTGAWIDYVVYVPGEPSRTIRRALFDRNRRSPRLLTSVEPLTDAERGARAVELLEDIQILPQVSRLSGAFVIKRALEDVVRNQSVIRGLSDPVLDDKAADLRKSVNDIVPMAGRLHDLAVARFHWNPDSREVFIGEPNLLTYRSKVGASSSGQVVRWQGFDIVNGRVGVRHESASTAFELRLRQGVTDTNAEAVLVGDGAVMNAGTALKASKNPAEAWQFVTQLDAAKSRIDGPDHIRRLWQQDLNAGYVLVVPTAPGDADPQNLWTWWRVHPGTGDTIGSGELGWGQSTIEYHASRLISGFVGGFAVGFTTCAIYNANQPTAQVLRVCSCYGLAGGIAVAIELAGDFSAGASLIGVAAAAICS